MMVRELGFEMKAQPSERMKTPEEVAREERERLQKLEVWKCPTWMSWMMLDALMLTHAQHA